VGIFHSRAGPAAQVQDELAVTVAAAAVAPRPLPDRIAAVRDALSALGGKADLRAIARTFKGRRTPAIREALDALVTLGLAESAGDLYALAEERRRRAAS